MQIQSLSGWKDHFIDGRKYLDTAVKGLSRPTVFNNELVFQLAAMAIEKMMIGIYQYHHQMPFDHTLPGLVDGLASLCPMGTELSEKIKRIDQIDDMCSLSPVHRNGPGEDDIHRILEAGREIIDFAVKNLPRAEMEFMDVP